MPLYHEESWRYINLFTRLFNKRKILVLHNQMLFEVPEKKNNTFNEEKSAAFVLQSVPTIIRFCDACGIE